MSGAKDWKERFVVEVDPDLEELIPGFIQNRRLDIETIRRALTFSDYEKIRVLGHTMKGAGGGYGFDGISQIGKSLESAAKQGHDNIIENLLEDLNSYLDNVDILYK
jgi:HPt (histidine-containing phosphotransfer) domain-containing protein